MMPYLVSIGSPFEWSTSTTLIRLEPISRPTDDLLFFENSFMVHQPWVAVDALSDD